ncbi:MAG: zinc ribbon domain-containing protein [Actinomycetota bacterium]
MSEPQHDEYCPRCGVAYEPTQEYCLECGARLPVNRGVVGVLARSWQRRFAWYPGDWIWPTLFFLVLTVAATAVALAANSARKRSQPYVATTPSVSVGPGASQSVVQATSTPATLPVPTVHPTITSGPLPTAPGTVTGTAATVTAPAPPNPNALAEWPANKSGYTLVLESLPVSGGKAAALARARQAKRNGLADVGVLTSAEYSSLHAGYYVVFAGIYRSAAAASAALASAHAKGFPDAFERQVTR